MDESQKKAIKLKLLQWLAFLLFVMLIGVMGGITIKEYNTSADRKQCLRESGAVMCTHVVDDRFIATMHDGTKFEYELKGY